MASRPGQGPSFNGEVFRRDYKVVIAMKRELAIIRPVRLAPKVAAGDYVAGQVLALYTGGANQGLYVDYLDGEANGRGTAAAILLEDLSSVADTEAASANLGTALFSGVVFKDSLIGYDSNAGTDLSAAEWADAGGATLVKIR